MKKMNIQKPRSIAERKQVCKDKKKEGLKKTGKFIGITALAIGVPFRLSLLLGDNDSTDYIDNPNEDGCEGGNCGMRCANCGNTDENALWDEGDTIYCSKCTHRTRVDTGEDAMVECPYCHRMRDRKAMYCSWCNDASWESSTPDEFEEIDRFLKDRGY